MTLSGKKSYTMFLWLLRVNGMQHIIQKKCQNNIKLHKVWKVIIKKEDKRCIHNWRRRIYFSVKKIVFTYFWTSWKIVEMLNILSHIDVNVLILL